MEPGFNQQIDLTDSTSATSQDVTIKNTLETALQAKDLKLQSNQHQMSVENAEVASDKV